jgi:hypothetical protein
MNLTHLLRFAPTLVIVGAMIYAGQAINETLAMRPRAERAEDPGAVLAKLGLDAVTGAVADFSPDDLALHRLRDPFSQAGQPAGASHGSAEPKAARQNLHAEFIDRAVLNATFIQNKTRFAVINGALYKPGQAVAGTGAGASALVVQSVSPSEVVLASEGGSYKLTYSDRLTSAKGAGARRGGASRRGPTAVAVPDGALAPGPDPRLDMIQAILGSQLGVFGSPLTNALGPLQHGPGRRVPQP